MAEQRLCPYCRQRPRERSIEHIVPRALGGSLTTERVCLPCNRRVGREIDMPLMQTTFVAASRHRHAVTAGGRNDRQPRPPQRRGTLEDGRQVRVELRRDGPRVIPFSKPELREDGTLRVSIPHDAPPGYLDDLLRRLEHRYGGTAHVFNRQPEPPQTVTWTESLLVTRWPRFGAKIALVLGSYLLGDDWLDSSTALRLHNALWDRDGEAEALNPLPTPVRRDDPLTACFHPPEHVLYAIKATPGAAVTVVLFGEWLYGAPLGDEVPLPEARAWVLDPHARTFRALSFDEWVTECVISQMSTQAPEGDRPSQQPPGAGGG